MVSLLRPSFSLLDSLLQEVCILLFLIVSSYNGSLSILILSILHQLVCLKNYFPKSRYFPRFFVYVFYKLIDKYIYGYIITSDKSCLRGETIANNWQSIFAWFLSLRETVQNPKILLFWALSPYSVYYDQALICLIHWL